MQYCLVLINVENVKNVARKCNFYSLVYALCKALESMMIFVS